MARRPRRVSTGTWSQTDRRTRASVYASDHVHDQRVEDDDGTVRVEPGFLERVLAVFTSHGIEFAGGRTGVAIWRDLTTVIRQIVEQTHYDATEREPDLITERDAATALVAQLQARFRELKGKAPTDRMPCPSEPPPGTDHED